MSGVTAYGLHAFRGDGVHPEHCLVCGFTRDDGRAEHEPVAKYHRRAGRLHLAATCSGEPGCVPQ